MANISNMPFAGIVVIFIILALFILSIIILFHAYNRYKRLSAQLGGKMKENNSFLRYTVNEFAENYKRFGTDVNTPAIIEDAINTKLGGLKLSERFLSNAVSLFVTLGLFGTFLGLSLSVGSLTELISYSNTSEWLSVLDSVGGGLMSALSGMGVAFYTSLVGVACSIILTILRSIFSPSGARETLETKMELWLDGSVAPSLPTDTAKSDVELVHQMIDALNTTSDSMKNTMQSATDSFTNNLNAFNETVETFNSGIHDFSEIEYSLRGSIERLDLSVRDIARVARGGESERSSRE